MKAKKKTRKSPVVIVNGITRRRRFRELRAHAPAGAGMNCPHDRDDERCPQCKRLYVYECRSCRSIVRTPKVYDGPHFHPPDRRSVHEWCADCGARVGPSIVVEHVQGALAAGIVLRAKRQGFDLRKVLVDLTSEPGDDASKHGLQ